MPLLCMVPITSCSLFSLPCSLPCLIPSSFPSARSPSLRLLLDAATVSQWEGRNTVIQHPPGFAVAVFFLREIAKNKDEFLKEIEDLILNAFSKVA